MTQGSVIQTVLKPEPYRINDGLARLTGIPLVAFVMWLAFKSKNAEYAHVTPIGSFFVAMLYTIAYWEGIRHIWMFLCHRYSHYSQTRTRLTILAATVLVYGVLVTLTIQYTVAAVFHFQCTFKMMVAGYFNGLIPTGLVLMVYEMVYFFDSWRSKVIESEAISRSHLQTQLDALKNQLDPHFLFNSLNTLSSLIDENEPAQQYLNRLADVYRYVLLSKNRNTVPLQEELVFVESFLYLAKVRFRHGLVIETDIPETALHHMVAPLSLQLLIENALKHNVVTREQPLHIRIEIKGDYIWVQNKINPKVHLESETKIGLNNIMERYRLLTHQPVKILNNQIQFEVALPLLPHI